MEVLIIGGGAAGLLAGIAAAESGAKVTIFEKMERPGKKMLITGKGRCNITNICDVDDFIKNIPGNGKFLYGVLKRFTNTDMINLLEKNGLSTKVERGGRVFPVSDKADDVVKTLVKIFTAGGGMLKTSVRVQEIVTEKRIFSGLKTSKGFFKGDAAVLTAGGASYPATGSDGDGARLAEKAGHTIVKLHPSLVPLISNYPYLYMLQGLSLRNVRAFLKADDRIVAEDFGEMIFTHFGISGPIVLSLSNDAIKAIEKKQNVKLIIDLKPALTREKLDARIRRDFELYSRKKLVNGMKDLIPQRLIPVVCDMGGLDKDKPVNQISREERLKLTDTLKNFTVPVAGSRPLAEAIVTAGGVSVKEINPKTMESKIIKGLYFAGEVIDVDGFTGGFNLQAAFSGGYAAGKAAAEKG